MAKSNRETEIAVATALSVAQKTQEMADALAKAKVQSDIEAAKMSVKVDQIVKSVENIERKLDEKYTTKEEHIILQKVVTDLATSSKLHEKFQDTLTGKIIGIAGTISAVAFVAGILITHFWH